MPSYTSRDLSIFKDQVVKVYSPSGTYLGVLSDAPYLTGFTEQVNGGTSSITITLPRTIDAYDGENQPGSRGTIVLGNVVEYWLYGPALPSSGLCRYVGVIDTIAPHLGTDGGEGVDVTLTPRSSLLGDHAVIGPINLGTSGGPYIDTMTMFNDWFNGTLLDPYTGLAYGAPFGLDPANPASTGNSSFFSFQNQSLLQMLTNILLLSPANYFFRMNEAAQNVSFQQYPLTKPNHVLKIGQHFNAISFASDNVPRKNLIVVQGAGTIQGIAAGSSIAQIGVRTYMKQDSRITDANTAQLLANGLRAFYDRPQVRAKVTIPDYRGDLLPGLGYDIEQFRVGQTVVLLDSKAPAVASSGPGSVWGQFVWGRDKWGGGTSGPAIWGAFKWGQATWGESVGSVFNVIVPIVAINYAYHSVELELGFRQPSMLRALYALESQFNDTTMVS